MKMIQLGILGLTLVGWAQGASIAITNASFENNTPLGFGCGPGCDYQFGLMSGWTIDGSALSAGTWRPAPATTPTFFNSVPDGINIGFAHDGASLRQVVGVTAVDGQTYELQVDLGYRKDLAALGYFDRLGIIELVVGTTRVLATGTAPTLGNWSTYTASYTAVLGDTGKQIEIVLTGRDASNNNTLGNFDNARLTSFGPPLNEPTDAVPEPAGLGIAGLAGLMLAGRYLKRRS
jgi:hypothetical protein